MEQAVFITPSTAGNIKKQIDCVRLQHYCHPKSSSQSEQQNPAHVSGKHWRPCWRGKYSVARRHKLFGFEPSFWPSSTTFHWQTRGRASKDQKPGWNCLLPEILNPVYLPDLGCPEDANTENRLFPGIR